MIRKIIIFLFLCLITTSCSFTPKPLSVADRYEEAKKDLKELFATQEPSHGRLDFNEALARGLKYNLDYRIKLVNSALQAGQLNVAMFTMLPALNVSYSVYSRNNVYASSGITSTGQPTDVLNATPNTIRSARGAVSWGLLDFGLGYVRSKQQGERIHIAQEEARKQLQQLSQDVLVAYWSAYSAQQLMVEAKEFQAILSNAKNKLAAAMRDKDIPQETILNYEAALLDGNRHIIQLQYKYDKAMLDLKHLINLPPTANVVLAPPPLALRQARNLRNLDFRKVDAITLVNRPELRGQQYQQKIAKLGIATTILQALPGITLNQGWNYNSNQFLVNQKWMDRSVDTAWNLLNLVSLPYAYDAAKTQVEFEKLKLMALTMTVLTETRYAFSHYESLRDEYEIAHMQTINADKLFVLNKNRKLASLASDQQVIIAKLHSLAAKMDENLLLSDLSTALGELYLSVGTDILPDDIGEKPLAEMTRIINRNFEQQSTWNFAEYVDKCYRNMFGNSVPFTVQIFGSYDLATVKAAQKRLNLTGPVNYAKTKHNGRDWYVMTYGKYSSAHEAKASINNLPKEARGGSPWIRQTNDLKWIG